MVQRAVIAALLCVSFDKTISIRTSSIAGVSGALLAGCASAQTVALTNATVIDGSGASMQRGVTIVVEGGRIRDMGASAQAPSGATVIDLTGKYLVPGIINGHGHVGPAPRDPQLRQYALYGVTTTTSMYYDQDDIQQFKAAQKAGDLRGARILTVMYRFMSEPFRPGSEAKTPEEARAKVDEIVAKGADMVKVWIDAQGGRYPKLTPEFTAAVMDQATKHNKIKMAHIVELEDAERIVDQGVNILAHNVRDKDIPDEFIATLKQKNVSVISTLAREEAMFTFGDGPNGPAFINEPLFQNALSPERLVALRTTKHAEQAVDPMRPTYQRMFETDKRNVKRLLDAGIRLGFGTDSGGEPNPFFLQGWFEHRQMELLRDAGLSPMQIIQTFSKNNSEMLDIDKDFGTLAKGKAADLLVLTKNPLDDIINMRSLEAVYLGGQRFDRSSSMRSFLVAAAVFVAAAFSPSASNAQDAPKFVVDPTWPKDLPKDWITGQLGGVCATLGTMFMSSTGATSLTRRNRPRSRHPRSLNSMLLAKSPLLGATKRRFPAQFTGAWSTVTTTSMWVGTATASSRNTTKAASCCCRLARAASSIPWTASVPGRTQQREGPAPYALGE